MTRTKTATWLGLAVSVLSTVALHQDVQSAIDPKYLPYVTLAGTILAAVGPSLRKPKQDQDQQ